MTRQYFMSYGDIEIENKGFQSNRNYNNIHKAANQIAEEFHFAMEEAADKARI